MKTFRIEISGVSSLIQHRFSEQAEGDVSATTRAIGVVERGTPRAAAERAAYRNADGTLYHPGAALNRLLREAGGSHKIKGSRKSAKFVVPAAVLVLDDTIDLHMPGDPSIKLSDFEVDSRPVVIPATRGRVMRHRPRLDAWGLTFSVEIDDELLPPDFVQQLMVEGGRRLGIGDFRPERGGPFGRFMVVGWEEVSE